MRTRLPAQRGEQSQGRGDGRLAGAALAGDEDQPEVEQRGHGPVRGVTDRCPPAPARLGSGDPEADPPVGAGGSTST